jgi:hypothetical protein
MKELLFEMSGSTLNSTPFIFPLSALPFVLHPSAFILHPFSCWQPLYSFFATKRAKYELTSRKKKSLPSFSP